MLYSLILLLAANAIGPRPASDAELLFQDGQQRLRAGKYGTAALAFHALISVYPESPLSQPAREAMRASEELERKQERAVVVRSVRFRNLGRVSEKDILERFRERKVSLAAQTPCRPRDLAEAKSVLVELLAERGLPNPRVRAATHHVAAHRVDITFAWN